MLVVNCQFRIKKTKKNVFVEVFAPHELGGLTIGRIVDGGFQAGANMLKHKLSAQSLANLVLLVNDFLHPTQNVPASQVNKAA